MIFHKNHIYNLYELPMWMVLMIADVNDFPHESHLKYLWPLWKFFCSRYNRRRVEPIYKDWNICDLCENFYVADTIRRWVKSIHKNQKNFICSYCGKSFTQAVNLMKTIDEDKRYLKCESCGSSFSNFHHLRVHNYISKTFMNLRKILNMILVDNEVQSWYSCMYCLCIFYRVYNALPFKKVHFPQTEQKNLK